jgi:DNA-binding XRE family transcriptional regulator
MGSFISFNLLDRPGRVNNYGGIGINFEIKEQDFENEVEVGIQLNLARRHLSVEQKKELIAKLREMGWSQEKVAKVVGVTQQRIDQIEEDVSNTNICNAYIPDLRYKINQELENY